MLSTAVFFAGSKASVHARRKKPYENSPSLFAVSLAVQAVAMVLFFATVSGLTNAPLKHCPRTISIFLLGSLLSSAFNSAGDSSWLFHRQILPSSEPWSVTKTSRWSMEELLDFSSLNILVISYLVAAYLMSFVPSLSKSSGEVVKYEVFVYGLYAYLISGAGFVPSATAQ